MGMTVALAVELCDPVGGRQFSQATSEVSKATLVHLPLRRKSPAYWQVHQRRIA